MKNSNDTIGNRTCDLPSYSVVPQPTAPLCVHHPAEHCNPQYPLIATMMLPSGIEAKPKTKQNQAYHTQPS